MMRAAMDAPLTRRQALTRLGLLGFGIAAVGCGEDAASDAALDRPLSCNPTSAGVQGPYFLETGALRSDIVEDRVGVPMTLMLRVVDADRECEPVERARIEVWHADAEGAYSAYDIRDGNLVDASDRTFLRGAQETDREGRVSFSTIFPGWYPGRTTHVHAKVFIEGIEHLTTQIYFDQAVNDEILATNLYGDRGPQTTTNELDFLLRQGQDPFFKVKKAEGRLVASALLSLADIY